MKHRGKENCRHRRGHVPLDVEDGVGGVARGLVLGGGANQTLRLRERDTRRRRAAALRVGDNLSTAVLMFTAMGHTWYTIDDVSDGVREGGVGTAVWKAGCERTIQTPTQLYVVPRSMPMTWPLGTVDKDQINTGQQHGVIVVAAQQQRGHSTTGIFLVDRAAWPNQRKLATRE